MKIVKFLFLFCFSVLLSCSQEDPMDFHGRHFDYSTLEDGIPDSVRYHVNPEFPVRVDSLRVLAIGNSFTNDAMQYMNDMVEASGIDNDRICVYSLTEGSSDFDTWVGKDYVYTDFQLMKEAGKAEMKDRGSLEQLLGQNWDVIVIQQSSTLSYVLMCYSSSVGSGVRNRPLALQIAGQFRGHQCIDTHTGHISSHVAGVGKLRSIREADLDGHDVFRHLQGLKHPVVRIGGTVVVEVGNLEVRGVLNAGDRLLHFVLHTGSVQTVRLAANVGDLGDVVHSYAVHLYVNANTGKSLFCHGLSFLSISRSGA